ncbi:MAG: phosphatidate cytidylyltransferase [Candidatus Omnitrophica bacterium]|nr:phosphatidate cytidylyltransferase [Candidatus Omnitrophota bacterium]
MLGKRIATSLFLITLIMFSLFYHWVFAVLVIAFTLVGLYEFFTMLEKKGILLYKYFGIAVGVSIPLSILFRFELTKGWELFLIVIALLLLILMQFRRRENSGLIVGISTTMFGILYVAWFLSFLIKLRYLENGVALFATVLLVTKLGDMGAYFVGVRFGKTPLLARISPKKSVEGAVGGLMFSILGAIACRPFFMLPLLHMAVIGLCLGILGQLGDLSESLMKRDCQVKDSGTLFPGLGGILDAIDSLLFTAPVFYFYMSNILK